MFLKDRIALVTGGSRGIGAAICDALAGEGAAIALHYHSERQVALDKAEALEASGVKVELFKAELAEANSSAAMVAAVVKRFGHVDVLVNNVGVTIGGKDLVETSLEDWHRVMNVNLNSVFYTCRATLPHMRAAGSGQIVNISSNVINSLPPGSAAYATSKSGLVALTKVLSKEEARYGIRVNAIAPGMIDAGMGVGALERRPPDIQSQFLNTIPMQRVGEAHEVAASVLFLVSDAASYVNGQCLNVNGGDRSESYQ